MNVKRKCPLPYEDCSPSIEREREVQRQAQNDKVSWLPVNPRQNMCQMTPFLDAFLRFLWYMSSILLESELTALWTLPLGLGSNNRFSDLKSIFIWMFRYRLIKSQDRSYLFIYFYYYYYFLYMHFPVDAWSLAVSLAWPAFGSSRNKIYF